jgi:hypothetical protein
MLRVRVWYGFASLTVVVATVATVLVSASPASAQSGYRSDTRDPGKPATVDALGMHYGNRAHVVTARIRLREVRHGRTWIGLNLGEHYSVQSYPRRQGHGYRNQLMYNPHTPGVEGGGVHGVRCSRMRVAWRAGHTDTVTMRIPRTCLPRAADRLRLNTILMSWTGYAYDRTRGLSLTRG